MTFNDDIDDDNDKKKHLVKINVYEEDKEFFREHVYKELLDNCDLPEGVCLTDPVVFRRIVQYYMGKRW